MKLKSKHTIYAMDKNNEPVAKLGSGDRVVFETLDCFSCELKSEEEMLESVDFSKINPATGPLYIEGAEVGDVLKVEIEKIEVEDQGVAVAHPGLGVLGDKIQESKTGIVKIKGDRAHFRGLSLPLKKMVGVIGTAPKAEPVNTGTPGSHGGNLDCTEIREGSVLYLPVNVKGALLAMGDLHAVMGDGEICGTGVEISGKVHVKVEVLKDFSAQTPFIETKDKYICLASHEDINKAIENGLLNMADFIMAKTDLSFEETYMLMSFVCDVKICQLVNPAKTIRVEIAKEIFA